MGRWTERGRVRERRKKKKRDRETVKVRKANYGNPHRWPPRGKEVVPVRKWKGRKPGGLSEKARGFVSVILPSTLGTVTVFHWPVS